MDHGFGLYRVPHPETCWYNKKDHQTKEIDESVSLPIDAPAATSA